MPGPATRPGRLVPAFVTVLALVAVGCAEQTPAAADVSDAAADIVMPDLAEDASAPSPVVVGQHPTQAIDPAFFEPLSDGISLDIVYGFQGLYMVILGVRTQGYFFGAMDMSVALTSSGGTEIASLALAEVRTVHAADDYDYVWEIQVIIDGDLWRGKPATLTMSIDDERGTSFEGSFEVVIGEPKLPGLCLEPSPAPTRAEDNCDIPAGLVNRLDPAGPTDGLDLAPGLGKSSLLVAARRGNALMLWESGVDVNPATPHHEAFINTGPWVDDAVPNAGPWALAIDGVGAAMIWGSSDGMIRYAAPGGKPEVLSAGIPVTAFVAPDGFKVLINTDGAVFIHTFGPDYVEVVQHFVVNMAKTSGPLAPTVEGELIVLTFPGLDADQSLMFQTASIFGGQCSVPSPLNLALGAGTVRRAVGLSYGLPIMAVTRSPISSDCQPSHRVISKSLSSIDGVLDTESAIPWTYGARIVARDDVASVIGLVKLIQSWQLVAQYADQQQLAPGAVAVGVERQGEVPGKWDVIAREGRYAMAWSDLGGAWLQRFCFVDPVASQSGE